MNYSIRMICAQLDLKPDTLRKWERRYHIFKPKRFPNGYRYYTDEDVQKIRDFLDVQRKRSVNRIVLDVPKKPKASKNYTQNPYRESIFKAIDDFNRQKLREIYDAVSQKYSVSVAFNTVWLPVLEEVGETAMVKKQLWVAREHFAVTHIREWIIDGIHRTTTEQPARILIAGPEKDMHELGMLVAMCEMVNQGIGCLYLGSNLPTASLIQTMKDTGLRHVSLTLSMPIERKRFKKIILEIQRKVPHAVIFVAGRASLPLSNLIQKMGCVFLGNNLEIGLEKIQRTMEEKK